MSLIAWYKLDGNALDSSGNNLNGTASGVSWVSGKIGQAGSFNGSVNISVPHNDKFNLYSQGTLSAWVKPNRDYPSDTFSASHRGIMGKVIGGGVGQQSFYMDWFGNNTYGNLRVGIGDSSGENSVNASYNFQQKWTHVVATWDGNILRLYANNILLKQTTQTKVCQVISSNFTIGYTFGNWDGLIDDVRIYDHALSEKEIKELAKAKILHYTFDEFQEPTENIVTNTNLDTGWSKSYCTDILWNDVSPPAGINSQVVSFIDANGDGSGYWFCYGDYAPQTPSTTYTISVYARTIGSSWSMYAYTADNSEIGRQSTNILTVPGDGNWHRLVFNPIFNPADSQSDSLSFNFSNIPSGQRCWLCAPQMEAKDHATPFVNRTRTGSVSDNSGYDNHADLALATTPQWVEDSRIGKGAYYFDGSGTADGTIQGSNIDVDVNITNTNNYPDGCTYSFWVKADTDAADRMSLFYGGSTINHIEIYSSSKYFRTEAATQNGYSFGSGVFPDDVRGQWAHFSIVFANRESGRPVRWYQNGNLFYTGSMDGGTNPGGEYFSFSKIARSTGSGSYTYAPSFKGYIDDVRIYATALSADDIKELYNTRAQIDNRGNFFSNNLQQTGHQPLIMDYTTWQDGQSGSVGSFSQYSTRNKRIMATDPWGKETVVWEGESLEGSTASSGIHYNAFPIDNTKLYRMSWWEKRVTNSTATYATYYAGLNGYGSTNGVWNLTNETYNTNPYFWSTGYSSLPVGQWFLVVGHVWPYTYTEGTTHPDSGRYFADGTRIGNISTDYRWTPVLTTGRSRTLSIYQPNAGGVIHHTVYPRIDICDGTEPSIAELLSGFDSNYIDFIREKGGTANLPLNVGNQLTYAGEISELGPTNGLVAYYPLNGDAKDYANANDGTVNGAIISAGINGKACYSFDGVDDYIDCGDKEPVKNINTAITVSLWAKYDTYVGSGGSQSYSVAVIKGPPWTFLMENKSNKIRFRITVGGSDLNASDTVSHELNRWYFFTGVYDGTAIKMYKDAVLVGTTSATGAIGTNSSTMKIGTYTGKSCNMDGAIQNVRIYNRALSPEEISILYDLEKGDTIKAKMDKNTLYVGGQIYEG